MVQLSRRSVQAALIPEPHPLIPSNNMADVQMIKSLLGVHPDFPKKVSGYFWYSGPQADVQFSRESPSWTCS